MQVCHTITCQHQVNTYWMHPIVYRSVSHVCPAECGFATVYGQYQCIQCLPHTGLLFCHTMSCPSLCTVSTACSCMSLPCRSGFCCTVFCHSCVYLWICGCLRLLASLMPALPLYIHLSTCTWLQHNTTQQPFIGLHYWCFWATYHDLMPVGKTAGPSKALLCCNAANSAASLSALMRLHIP